MSLTKTFPLKSSSKMQGLSTLEKDSLESPLCMRDNINIESVSKKFFCFNGIIFRDQSLLKSLGFYDHINKVEKQNLDSRTYQKHSYPSLCIKLIFDSTLNREAKLILTQYNAQALISFSFVFMQRNYTYSDYNFLKLNVASEKSVQSTKLLLCSTSYERLVKAFNHKSIKFFINPSLSHRISLSTQTYTIQRICSLDQSLSQAQFEDNVIEYTSSCNFNGKQECLAVFTNTKVIILHNGAFIKAINKDQFRQNQYWIENQYDWISFQSRDHLIVFQQKIKEVSIRAIQIESRKSAIMSNIQTNLRCHFQQEGSRFSLNQSQLKINGKGQENVCFNDQPKTLNEMLEDKKKSIHKSLFEQEERMVDENQQIQQNHQIDKAIQPVQQILIIEHDEKHPTFMPSGNLNSVCSIIEEQHSQMIDESKLNQDEDFKQEESQKIVEEYQRNIYQYNYSTVQSSIMMNEESHYQFPEKKSSIIDGSTIRTPIQKNINQSSLEGKQNSQNFINQTLQSTKNSQAKQNLENILQSQYVYNHKQSLFKLEADLQSDLLHDNHHEITRCDEKYQSRQQISRFTNIQQISQSLLAGLTFNKELYLFRKTYCDQYLKEEVCRFDHFNQLKMFQSKQKDTLLMAQQNVLLQYDVQSKQTRQIKLQLQLSNEVKDAKGVNENVIALLTNNSIQLIDQRQNCQNQLFFKGNQFFEKLGTVDNVAVVGRSDGKVKIYDLRFLKPKSLNNFDLNHTGAKHIEYNQISKFKNIEILSNKDIFCQYNSSAFVIEADSKEGKSIYCKNMKKKDRTFIAQYSIHPKIIQSIDDYYPQFQDQVTFSVDSRGESVVALYKNFNFLFKAGEQKLQSWNKIQCAFNERYFYLNFNKFSEKELISGVYHKNGLSLKATRI